MRELSGSHVQISALRFCQTAAPSGNCLPWQLSPFTHRWHKMCTLFFYCLFRKLHKKTESCPWWCDHVVPSHLIFFPPGLSGVNCFFSVVLVVFPVLSCVSLSPFSTRPPFPNTRFSVRGAPRCRKKKWRSLG